MSAKLKVVTIHAPRLQGTISYQIAVMINMARPIAVLRIETENHKFMTYALVIHGGAGARPEIDYREQKAHLTALITSGQEMLLSGQSALETVATLVADQEASGLYVAGKGAAPNTAGNVELDASIMDGKNQGAGAVAAVRDLVHPIRAALGVMQDGRHVMLTADSAREFALSRGEAAVDNPEDYYTDHVRHGSGAETASHGTVGAVALDLDGHLAGATSTGGTFNKRPGRVGDTPLIGAGTWADDRVAVSCTGIGEAFMRTCAAHDLAARMRYGSVSLDVAARAVLDEVKKCDGNGGLIAVDHQGRISMPYNSQGMKRAAVSSTMSAVVRVFEDEIAWS
jgi:isoaspartyl peptidase/L-asparaginase-like protein (Ntn-hydrolase superfamily)